MNITNNTILFFAFRYALGRMSTAPSIMVEALKLNWDKFSESDQSQIKREIIQAIEGGRAGMECDIKEWEKLL